MYHIYGCYFTILVVVRHIVLVKWSQCQADAAGVGRRFAQAVLRRRVGPAGMLGHASATDSRSGVARLGQMRNLRQPILLESARDVG